MNWRSPHRRTVVFPSRGTTPIASPTRHPLMRHARAGGTCEPIESDVFAAGPRIWATLT